MHVVVSSTGSGKPLSISSASSTVHPATDTPLTARMQSPTCRPRLVLEMTSMLSTALMVSKTPNSMPPSNLKPSRPSYRQARVTLARTVNTRVSYIPCVQAQWFGLGRSHPAPHPLLPSLLVPRGQLLLWLLLLVQASFEMFRCRCHW